MNDNQQYITLTDDNLTIGNKCDICGKKSTDTVIDLVTDIVYCDACYTKASPLPTFAERFHALEMELTETKARLAALEGKVTGL